MAVYLRGLVSNVERKSMEPIAVSQGVERRRVQHFVGAGIWFDDDVRVTMWGHVAKEIGSPQGALIVDGSGFPKSGEDSVGVARQYCGRLGKVDNCQVGVFIAYASRGSCALLDAQPFLPGEWIDDNSRRAAVYIPSSIAYRKHWEIALDLIIRVTPHVPYAWILGDDEFGRPTEFRDALAKRLEGGPARYLLEVPCNTNVRRPANAAGRARKWRTVERRKKERPHDTWRRYKIADGEKGPIEVFAFSTRVETQRRDTEGRALPPVEEVLLVMHNIRNTKTWYFLAPKGTPTNTKRLVAAASLRHDIEEVFEAAKGEAGLDHYELRSWTGWHHHITLSMLALWFLVLERRRFQKKLRR